MTKCSVAFVWYQFLRELGSLSLANERRNQNWVTHAELNAQGRELPNKNQTLQIRIVFQIDGHDGKKPTRLSILSKFVLHFSQESSPECLFGCLLPLFFRCLFLENCHPIFPWGSGSKTNNFSPEKAKCPQCPHETSHGDKFSKSQRILSRNLEILPALCLFYIW